MGLKEMPLNQPEFNYRVLNCQLRTITLCKVMTYQRSETIAIFFIQSSSVAAIFFWLLRYQILGHQIKGLVS